MGRRRTEGSSLKLEVMQKVPESAVPVVHERMSQGKGVKGRTEKKKVPGWSVDKMKEKPNIAVVEDTEELRFKPERNGLMLEEMGWKEWKRKSWTSKRSKKAKERPSEVGVPPWNGGVCAKTRNSE